MPGLVGYIDINIYKSDLNRPQNTLDDMTQPLIYYDWYKVDKLSLPGVTAACVHMGVLQEKSVITTEDGIHLLLHGEIYNDDLNGFNQTEYIINCYRKYGKDFLIHLNGSFAILLVDEKKGKTILATDRIGSKPIVYLKEGNRLYFSPEVKSLMKISGHRPELDLYAVSDIMVLGFATNRRTLLKNASYLDNGTAIVITDNKEIHYNYWDYIINESSVDLGIKTYEKVLAELLVQAVKRQKHNGTNDGVLLSGGYDSRAILGCKMLEGEVPTTISYGYKGANSKYSDVGIAKRLSELARTNHIHCDYDLNDFLNTISDIVHITDGMGRPLPEWTVHKEIRKKHGINIIYAGDECFGRFDYLLANEKSVFSCSYISSINDFNGESLPFSDSALYSLSEYSKKNLDRLSKSCTLKNNYNRMDYFFQKEYMIPLIGMWRYATSTEVEIRNPWYDNDILDFLIELPVEYRKGKKLFKKTVRNLFSDLFRTEVARKVSKPESRDWQKWISRNSQVLVSQMVDGNSAVDNLFDQVRINNLVKVNNSQEASIKVKLNRIKNVFKVGKSGNSWVANESPYFIYHIMEKLNKTLINIRSLITKRPPFGSPNLRLSKHRAIWNTIRLRQGLLCASSRSTSVKNQNKN